MRKTLLTLAMAALAPFSVADTQIHIQQDQSGPVINKNVYGQFAEHLGRGIYEGIWVGEDSDIPNTKGFRKDVLKALKELQVPLIRWPGGCFADEYHWKDGIGPRDQRKVTINTTWGGVTDDNAFGTHEFFDLVEMLGADAYVNANLGTGSPREMAEWLEYMTSEADSTLANLRRANGREKPWKVDFFAIGNESWGCGGTMRPEYYADLYKHWATFAKTPADNRPVMIASGGHTDQTEWTETLITQVQPTWSMRMDAIAHHYYTLPTGNWDKHGSALDFTEEEWVATFAQTLRLREFIETNIAILDEHDPEKKVGFYVDEWGTWYDTPEGDNPGFLYQQNSLRDAIVAALNFNLFHEHAERIQMTNIAQMVNVLQAMILTDKEKMLLTPTYHAFKMYIPFQGATVVPIELKDVPEYSLAGHTVPQVSATAARGEDGKIYLALVNTHPRKVENILVSGTAELQSAKGQMLTGYAMDAHNTFQKPNRIKPEDVQFPAKNGKLSIELMPKSIVVLAL